jgi:hypothetical protein
MRFRETLQEQRLQARRQSARRLRADEAWIGVDCDFEIPTKAGIGNRHHPGCREAIRQVCDFDRLILEREVICGRDVVHYHVE